MGRDGNQRPQQVDRELDIRGQICPYTFVRTKLALEAMDAGQTLRVLLDYEPATESVPRSLRDEGHQVLWVGPCGEKLWEIVVQKG